MTLNEDIVQRLDYSKKLVQEVYDSLNPEKYVESYEKIWKARAEIEFIVISLKLLNNLEERKMDEKWKEEFSATLKQVRSEDKVRQVFLETLTLFHRLENINNIIEFYKTTWMIKEKMAILLTVVKPKIKIQKSINNNQK
ncbi:MAG: hypothetical protein ACFFDW_07675 [Candidatus Thorarchaeota archaeon]